MRDIGELKWFLGIQVICDRIQRKIWLCQDLYINKIAYTFYLTDKKALLTLMAINKLFLYNRQASLQEIYKY